MQILISLAKHGTQLHKHLTLIFCGCFCLIIYTTPFITKTLQYERIITTHIHIQKTIYSFGILQQEF